MRDLRNTEVLVDKSPQNRRRKKNFVDEGVETDIDFGTRVTGHPYTRDDHKSGMGKRGPSPGPRHCYVTAFLSICSFLQICCHDLVVQDIG